MERLAFRLLLLCSLSFGIEIRSRIDPLDEGIPPLRVAMDKNVSTPAVFMVLTISSYDCAYCGANIAPLLLRASNTFRHVPRLWWVVVENIENAEDSDIRKYLTNCGAWRHTHLVAGKGKTRNEMISVGLSFAASQTTKKGVVHVMNLHRLYTVEAFGIMRMTETVAYLPLTDPTGSEVVLSPMCSRNYHYDWPEIDLLVMNLRFLRTYPSLSRLYATILFQDVRTLLESLGTTSLEDITILPGCTVPIVWKLPMAPLPRNIPPPDDSGLSLLHSSLHSHPLLYAPHVSFYCMCADAEAMKFLSHRFRRLHVRESFHLPPEADDDRQLIV